MKAIFADRKENETVLDAYNRSRSSFTDAIEFLHAMDILFVLDLIDVDAGSESLQYA
ncbi:ABC-three component system middle component 7 [Cupriavidus sp. amp6]|uniref:ABC-three component system middle component 7 n=1 Tax=Cupriavidus sp. amp6 TaxID=388051 RepID=UPI0035109A5D